MANGKIVFNGIDAATGDYLVPPVSLDELAATAVQDKLDENKRTWLKFETGEKKKQKFDIQSDRDPKKIADAGWGLILPAGIAPENQKAILDALGPLLALRKEQTGPRYREYVGADGYRHGDEKDTFLAREPRLHGPGRAQTDKVPYYLMIVGDPGSIPFEFQYELDVAFAVGRIAFRTLDEYRRYADTVVAAETGKLVRPRAATFFGVKNNNDEATRQSAEKLIDPLSKAVTEDKKWLVRTVAPANATKAALRRLLGGADTPALLFTASHGVGLKYEGDLKAVGNRQFADHGALICKEWPGPRTGPLTPDHYFAAADLQDDACPAGMIACFFACYGAGTPYYDAFPNQMAQSRKVIAPRSFLAALPMRMLSHPGGGALAVVGHVERAWGDSIAWGQNEVDQSATFRDMLWRLRDGHPIGSALEPVNDRYAEIATMLGNAVDNSRWDKSDAFKFKLAEYWVSTHDARGYAVLGDPAVKLAVPSRDSTFPPPPPQPERITVQPVGGAALPDTLDPEAEAGAAAPPKPPPLVPGGLGGGGGGGGGVPGGQNALAYGVFGDIKDSLSDALRKFGEKLGQFAENLSTLEVVTLTSEAADQPPGGKPTDVFAAAKVGAVTVVQLSGQTRVCVPTASGKIDDALWQVHLATVKEAQAYRTAMFKTAADVLGGLLGRGG